MPLIVACINVDKKEAGTSGDNLARVFAAQKVDLGIVLEPPGGLTWKKRRTEFSYGDYSYATKVIQTGGWGQGEPIVFFCKKGLGVGEPSVIDLGKFVALAQFRKPAYIDVRQGTRGKVYRIAGFHAPCTGFDNNATVVMSLLTRTNGPLQLGEIDVLLADTNQSSLSGPTSTGSRTRVPRGAAYVTRLQVASVATMGMRRPGLYDRVLTVPTIVNPRKPKWLWSKIIAGFNHQLIGVELP